MPISILFYISVIVVILFLLFNVVLPLITPKYPFFWMFRSNKYIDVNKELEEAMTEKEIKEIEKKVKEEKD